MAVEIMDDPKPNDGGAKDAPKPDDKGAKADPKVNGKSDDKGGELAGVFDDPGDKGKDKPKAAVKPADLKLSVPDDLKELVGDVQDYVTAASEAGITQEQLDRFMAVHFDRVKAAAESAENEAEQTALGYRRDLMADTKLGGAHLKQTMQVAERGARALGGSALAVALAKHLKGEAVIDGAVLVRAFHMAGLAQNEDRLGGTGGDGASKGDDSGLTPDERRFKATNPKTWAAMQAERKRAS